MHVFVKGMAAGASFCASAVQFTVGQPLLGLLWLLVGLIWTINGWVFRD
jgi:hypothetical protein